MPSSPLSRSSETVLDLIERLRDQRDGLYTRSVNPRRNAERALAAFDRGDLETARSYMQDVRDDLFGLSSDYTAMTDADEVQAVATERSEENTDG